MWETKNIHIHPYQTALGSGQHSGLYKINKLPNDKTSALISTDQPHNCNIDKAPQNSSSQNLTRKEKIGGTGPTPMAVLKNTKKGKTYTGSGVYHPCLNVSYMNPRDGNITNAVSRAELAAIAAAIIHGHSHIATDSLTSMHQK